MSKPLNILNIDINHKSKPTIASTNLQYTASTHDHKQTLELNTNTSHNQLWNLERDFPIEVMATDSLNNTPLLRTYSETEAGNFHSSTGTRIFYDYKHRPYHGYPSTRRISFGNDLLNGIEDEYIPNFNFNDNLLTKWFDDDLYDDKNYSVHAAPISVPKTDENLKTTPIDLSSLLSLPENFKDLPFSQRKKMLTKIYPNYSYSELTNMIKTIVKTNSNSNLSKLSSRSSSSSLLQNYLKNPNQQEYDINKRGAIVMNHVLLDVIGHGSWGVIRECKDTETSEMRAVKIISTQNERIQKIFLNEIKVWSMLKHENILPLMSFKETKENLFALTKINYGGTLFELVYKWGFVKDQKISTTERAIKITKIMKQILQGIQYMHRKFLVHGDIKLENVLIDQNDHILICDFGMTKFISRNLNRTRSEQPLSKLRSRKLHESHDDISLHSFGPSLASTTLDTDNDDNIKMPDKHIGSLPYALPELLTQHHDSISTKQDIWALGVMLYTMLIGELPFKHSYEPRLKMMILKGNYNDSLLLDQYGDHDYLIKAVYGCLNKDIAKRWTIEELIALLPY